MLTRRFCFVSRLVRVAIILMLSTLFGLSVTNQAHAGVNQWTTHGPEAGWIRTLAIDPLDPDTLYAGTFDGGVFKSTDGGNSWFASSAGLISPRTGRTGLADVDVRSVAIDPADPMAVYAGTDSGIFKSADAGASWHAIDTSGLAFRLSPPVTIAPTAPTILYASAGENGIAKNESGIAKSTDGGVSWTASNTGLAHTYITSLVVDPVTPTILYAGSSGGFFARGGIFKSVDAGNSWTLTGLESVAVRALAIDPVTPTTVYGAGDEGVFKSTNAGASWTAINTGLANAYFPDGFLVQSVTIDPATPTTVYAGLFGGVFKSTNGGASWDPINTGLTDLLDHP